MLPRPLLQPLWRPLWGPLLRSPLDAGVGGAGSPSIDADALAWAAAVTANGGTYSAAQRTALSSCITSLKLAGIWPALYCFGPLWGNDLPAALIQKVGAVWAPATHFNFVAGDYSPTTGLMGNGVNKCLDTGVVPSAVLTLNDTHMAVYNRASSAAGGFCTMGSNSSGSSRMLLYAPDSTGLYITQQYANGAGDARTSTSPPYGLLIASRESAASVKLYKNGALVATTLGTAGSVPSATLYVFCLGLGAGGQFIAQPLSQYSCGSGLSPAQAAAYTTLSQAFQATQGRQV